MASILKTTLTFDEVAMHNHRKDCWIIVHGKVYDVTSFLGDHPGGDEVLLSAVEKDATIDFEDVGHSDSAIEMMRQYLVGEVDVSTLPVKFNDGPPPPKKSFSNQSFGLFVKSFQFLLPLPLLGLAFALQYYGKGSKSTDA